MQYLAKKYWHQEFFCRLNLVYLCNMYAYMLEHLKKGRIVNFNIEENKGVVFKQGFRQDLL